MTLAPGTRLGPHEIIAPLGAGGMGEVYRARDTRLGREVAIKVLPAHLSAHPEIRARFEREAHAVSALNHPNICVLHDNLVLDEWFTKQGCSAKDSEFDLIYVNGGNNLENLKTPDDTVEGTADRRGLPSADVRDGGRVMARKKSSLTLSPARLYRQISALIRHELRDESAAAKGNAPRSESPGPRMRAAVRLEFRAAPVALVLRRELSWHHYRLLLRVAMEGM